MSNVRKVGFWEYGYRAVLPYVILWICGLVILKSDLIIDWKLALGLAAIPYLREVWNREDVKYV